VAASCFVNSEQALTGVGVALGCAGFARAAAFITPQLGEYPAVMIAAAMTLLAPQSDFLRRLLKTA
jgi:hypothetical protein